MLNVSPKSPMRPAWRDRIAACAVCVMLLPACTSVSTPKPAVTEQTSAQNCSVRVRDLSSPWAREHYRCVSDALVQQEKKPRIRNLLTSPVGETMPKIAGVEHD